MDDIWEEKHDLAAALAGIPTGEPMILLAHEPVFADAVYPTGHMPEITHITLTQT